jgi:DNA-binding IclR family transcriptional regulator
MKEGGKTVPAIERAIRILEALARSQRGLTLSEISRRFGIPKSSTHHILGTLEAFGYLRKHELTGRCRLGLRFISLSRHAIEGLGIREESRPALLKLCRSAGLAVHLAVLDGDEAVIIEKIEALGAARVASWIGRRLALNCTSLGKSLIAHLPPQEIENRFRRRGAVRHNERTIAAVHRLCEELALVRRRGYAIDDEEDEIGVRCVGAPVIGRNGETVAAVSVAGSTEEIPRWRFEKLGRAVQRAAEEISLRLDRLPRSQPVQ